MGWKSTAALVGCLILGTAARAQYIPGPGNASPIPEPVPTAPSATPSQGGPQPPPAYARQWTLNSWYAPPGPDTSMSLPPSVPNAFMDADPAGGINLWVSGQLLVWWPKDAPASVPVVTTSLLPDTFNDFAAIGQPNTRVLFGGSDFQSDALTGARFAMGYQPPWFLPVEVSGFWASGTTTPFRQPATLSGSSVLARPIFAVQPDVNDEVVFLYRFPELASGGLVVTSGTDLWGVQTQVVLPLTNTMAGLSGGFSMDVYAGYAYYQLNESLKIDGIVGAVNPIFTQDFAGITPPLGSVVATSDAFDTRNTFNGAKLGVRPKFTFGFMSVGLKAALGLGQTVEELKINGSSALITRPGATPIPATGGILAVPSNIGTQRHADFSVIPELGVTLGYQFGGWFGVFVGYDFLYWSNVVRPGNHLNRFVDTRQVPTDIDFNAAVRATQPAAFLSPTDYWVHGLHLGISLSF